MTPGPSPEMTFEGLLLPGVAPGHPRSTRIPSALGRWGEKPGWMESEKQNWNPSGTSLRALLGSAPGATDISGAVRTQASLPVHTAVRLSV